jgi:benzoyl-CoA reductase/2-hydroxyglutaryl-CoA dehydratase subunit BcrC/BadD/HgdB
MSNENRGSDSRFGWFCPYTPIEILAAAGRTPERLNAGDALLHKANPLIYPLICPYIRVVFDQAQQMGFGALRGVLFVKCCDGMIRL